MKKLTIALFAMLSMAFTVKAQQYVSTEPATGTSFLRSSQAVPAHGALRVTLSLTTLPAVILTDSGR